jgi:hypothetical protein
MQRRLNSDDESRPEESVMPEASPNPSTRSKPPWSKHRFLAVYWLGQGLAAYFLWPLLFDVGKLRDVLRVALDPGYAAWMGLVLVFIMAAQAAFLMPVCAPQAESRPPGWRRHVLVALAIGGMAAYASFLIAPMVEALGVPERWIGWAWPLGQWPWLLIVPAAITGPIGAAVVARRYREGTPVLLSVTIAACSAASLIGGSVLAACSVIDLFDDDFNANRFVVAALGAILLGWPAGTILMLGYCRRLRTETALGLLASRVFIGTAVEAGAIIPLDIMVRRKSNCYCGEGTLWALTICWGAGTLLLGPAIWLVPLARRRRRWHGGHCPVCDYDMRGHMTAERCPECGAGWRASSDEALTPPASSDPGSP